MGPKATLAGRKVKLVEQWPAWDAAKNGPLLNMIPAGTSGTVREVVPAKVKGAHTDQEDCVVVEFQTETGVRAVALGISETKYYLGQELRP